MPTALIELEDGILVEVEVQDGEPRQVTNRPANQVGTTIKVIQPILINISKSVTATWKEIEQGADVDQAEINFGLSFGIEGNIYVTKSTAGANLTVKLVLKPKKEVRND